MAQEAKKTETPTPTTHVLNHPGHPVFVLIPFDTHEQRVCRDKLQELEAYCEQPPRIVSELRVGKLPGSAFVYVCHPASQRVRGSDGRFTLQTIVHLSKPIAVNQFTLASGDEDGMGYTNIGGVVDALTSACQNERAGRVYVARLSAEKEPENRVAKLFNQ